MKCLNVLFGLLLLVTGNLVGQGIKNNYYGGCKLDNLEDFIQNKSSIYMVGRTESYTTWPNLDAFVSKVDTNGNMLWLKTITLGQYNLGRKIIFTKDSNIMVLSNDGWLVSRITKLDLNGNVLFAKEIQRNDRAIIETLDKGFLTVGKENLSKIDSTGNVQYMKNYIGGHGIVSAQQDGVTDFTSVIQTQDTGYIAVGYTMDSLYTFPFILKTDKMGNIQWYKTINQKTDQISPSSLIPQCIIKDSPNTYLYTGNIENKDTASQINPFIIKFDVSGNILWSKSYKILSNNNRPHGISKMINGDYMLFGAMSTGLYTMVGYSIRLDANGNIIWGNKYTTGVYLSMINNTENILLGGSAKAPNNFSPSYPTQSDINILKIDSFGNSTAIYQPFNVQVTSFTCTTRFNPIRDTTITAPLTTLNSIPVNRPIYYDSLTCSISTGAHELETQNGISIFPNPTKNSITISQTEPTFNKYEIYSLNGKLVAESKINNILQKVDLTNCAEGMYIVKLIGNQKVEFKKIVVTE